MAGIVAFLSSSEAVANFQEFCGVVPNISRTKFETENTQITTQGSSLENTDGMPNLRKKNIRQDISPKGDDDTNQESSSSERRDYVITNKPLYFLFMVSSMFVSELFYITFWPFWLWNVDGHVCRRLCIFWFIFMYLGQAAKDIIRRPRPRSPPVVQLEAKYALEYGFPSTHAMAGAGIPFGLVFLHLQRCTFPLETALAGAAFCCMFVCCSRVYLGMHSILDVLCGLLFVSIIGVVTFPILDLINHFLVSSPFSPFVCIVLPLAVCLCYPSRKRWSTARGDTTIILAMSGGAFFAFWLSLKCGLAKNSNNPPFYMHTNIDSGLFGLMLLRFLVGSAVLGVVRATMRTLSYRVMCHVVGVSKDDQRSRQKLLVEVPYKYVTYFTIGFMAVLFVPQVYKYLGIERADFFTEAF